jgi:iron complex outermembrane receptor protein
MLTRASFLSYSVLIVFFFFTTTAFATEKQPQSSKPLTDEEKLEQVKSYFESEYQEEDYFRTDRLLLTATKHLIEAKDAPAIASVVTGEEIRNAGAMNLLDVLQRLPGIGVTRNFYSVYEVEVRGLKSTRNNRVQLLMDGHKLEYPTTGGASWAWDAVSMEQVKRIEVIRGPGSALYGANAFSGIVNVVSQKGDDIDGTQVSAGGGSFELKRINVLHGREYGETDVLASLTYYDVESADLYVPMDAIGQSGYTDDWAESWDGSLRISWKDFTLSGKYLKRENGPYIGVTNVLTDESILETEQYYIDLIYTRELNERWNISSRGYYDYLDVTFNWKLFPDEFITLPRSVVPPPPLTIGDFTFPGGVYGTPHFNDKTFGVELGTDYQIANNNKLTLGLFYEKLDHGDVTHYANFDPNTGINLGSYQDITSWANWSQEMTREIIAAYIQDEWQPSETVGVTFGVRYDDYSDVGDSTNPRLGIVWNFHQKADVKLLYGTAFRVPTLDELYSINNPAAIGNPNLIPEEMETIEAGLAYRPIDGMNMNVNAFYNQVSDIIRLVPLASTPGANEFQNTGDATIYGLEFDLRYYWQRENEAYFNYTWQHPEDDETGEEIPDVPSSRWNLGLTMRFWEHLKGNANILYVGERPRALGDPRPDLDSYTKVDLNLILDNLYKTLKFRGSVYNLFDEDISYPATPGTLYYDYPAPGRTIFLEVRYTF